MALIAQGQLGIWDRNHIAGFHRPSLHISQRLYSASRPPLCSIIKDLDAAVMNRQRSYVTFKGIEYIWEEEMRDGANLLGEIGPCRHCCQEGWWGYNWWEDEDKWCSMFSLSPIISDTNYFTLVWFTVLSCALHSPAADGVTLKLLVYSQLQRVSRTQKPSGTSSSSWRFCVVISFSWRGQDGS